MGERLDLNYYYGQEAEQFTFYRLPKALITDSRFKEVSNNAKLLYGLMLDRMSLSIKNKWFDAEKRAYIYFSVEDTMEMLNCKKNKALDTLKALEEFCLIERKRQGQGKPAIIYVKSFMEEIPENVQRLEKQTSETEEKVSEVGKINPNNTKKNDTEYSNPDLIVSEDTGSGLDEYHAYANIIRENIEIDILYQQYPYDKELLDGIYDLILETVLCKGGNVIIASNEYPVQLVKSKFLKLNSSHIQYVMDCLKETTSKVRNIKKYLLAALFNAPSTMKSYYQAEVNHDMPQFAVRAI